MYAFPPRGNNSVLNPRIICFVGVFFLIEEKINNLLVIILENTKNYAKQ